MAVLLDDGRWLDISTMAQKCARKVLPEENDHLVSERDRDRDREVHGAGGEGRLILGRLLRERVHVQLHSRNAVESTEIKEEKKRPSELHLGRNLVLFREIVRIS